MTTIKSAFVALALCSALDAAAAMSPQYDEWRNGPVQWIMTPEEQKTWRSVNTDAEAIRFIDLFWVRRDPTLGTPVNEFKDEFTARVKYADEHYPERNRRGALTDRGRVMIVLGPPANFSGSLGQGKLQGNMQAEGYHASAGAQGAREQWIYGRDVALKYDLPQLEVRFIEDPGTRRVNRDLTSKDFPAASANAIRMAVVNPTLNEVPNWAPRGGIEPKLILRPADAPRPIAKMAPQPTVISAVPLPKMAPRGVSNFVLTRDVFAVETETKTDPFTTMQKVSRFTRQDELGWAAQFCSGSDDEPTLRFTLRITGKAQNEEIDREAPADEIVPDRVKANPGCYMLRGAIPLEDMSPGAYKLELGIEDETAAGGRHVLTQDFQIE